MWKAIWKTRLPNKVKVFAWRVCTDCLPSKHNLLKRRVVESAACDFCNYPTMDASHAVLHCFDIRAAWVKLLPVLTNLHNMCSVTDAVMFLLHRGEQESLARFFLITWAFWYMRNKWTIEHSLLDPINIANHAII